MRYGSLTNMLKIKPFRAIRYNTRKISDIANVLAPPYDVLSDTEVAYYHDLDPHNVIRLILGQRSSSYSTDDGRYARARRTLDEWKNAEVLVTEKRPAFYTYEHRYSIDGCVDVCRGFIGLMKLAALDEGIIFPHERTLDGPKQDRLALMQSCSAHFSQIFTLYDSSLPSSDPNISFSIDSLIADSFVKPIYHAKLADHHEYLLSKIDDVDACRDIAQAFQNRKLFIADGHHRYTTSLIFLTIFAKLVIARTICR